MQSIKKMGFWAVTSLVIGSQIGSGIFLLPTSLSVFGGMGLLSWLITATGAILLAFVFAGLSAKNPKTGGPHTYIEAAFGEQLGFFSAWTYWVISWVSTPMVVISVVSYLSPLLGNLNPLANLTWEIVILMVITGINLLGVKSAGRVEFVFTLCKLLPLLVVPLAGIAYFNWQHFVPFNPTGESSISVLNAAALLTLWGFIGVESATTPGESVINPKKTIPLAIIIGTALVALVYIFSSTMVMGIVPIEILSVSKAPFADAAQIIFGGNWYFIISIAAAVVCLGTLNAWVLTSGQIALGAAHDGHLPRFFSSTTTEGAPVWGLILSALGMIPILIVTMDQSLVAQVNTIIDVSVTAFLFIYALSVLSYLKQFFRNKTSERNSLNLSAIVIGMGALLFCIWAFYSSGIKMVGFAMLVPLSGIPIYLWKKIAGFRVIQADAVV